MRSRLIIAVAAIACFVTTPVLTAGPSLEVGVGAGISELEGSLPEIDDSPSGRFNFGFSFPIFPDLQQLRLGVGFSVEGSSDYGPRVRDEFDDDDYERPYSELTAFTPELKLAWQQPLGDRWFIEPSVGFSAPIARYSIGEIEVEDSYYGDDVDVYEDESWTAVGFGLRPAVAVGFNINEHNAIGLEGSYLIADIDFDDGIGGDYRAFALSFFYRYTF